MRNNQYIKQSDHRLFQLFDANLFISILWCIFDCGDEVKSIEPEELVLKWNKKNFEIS